MDGILVLDKPAGMSSNAALQVAKHLFGAAKAGHTGSLDPLATGVLPLCFGEATKLSQFLLDADKTYVTTVRLGIRTTTGDAEGEVITRVEDPAVDETELTAALRRLTGTIEQVPPMYSALKHQGVPLYQLARQGVEVERAARQVTIHRLDLLRRTGSELEIEIDCTKGTYVRTLADDLGQLLGCGAHVTALRRTRAGPFHIEESVTLAALQAEVGAQDAASLAALDAWLLPADQVVRDLPAVDMPAVTARCIRQGQPVLVRHLPAAGLVRLYDESRFIGIGEILDDGRVGPRRMIAE